MSTQTQLTTCANGNLRNTLKSHGHHQHWLGSVQEIVSDQVPIVLYISSLTWYSDSLCAKGQERMMQQYEEGGGNKTVCRMSEQEEKGKHNVGEQSPTCITEVACKYDEANIQMQGGGRKKRRRLGEGADMIKL